MLSFFNTGEQTAKFPIIKGRMLFPIAAMSDLKMATASRINAEDHRVTLGSSAPTIFGYPMMGMPSPLLPHLRVLPSQSFAARSASPILAIPSLFKNILGKLCHIILHKERLTWYEVEGDNLWVLFQSGKATGIEIWKSPYCLSYVDKDKPFYIRFSPEDESLYCDIGNAATLELAKQTAEAYYATIKPPCQTQSRRTSFSRFQ